MLDAQVAELTSTIPVPAWEQIGIVIIFTLLLLGVLSWFATREKNWQTYITSLFDKILERDAFWQKWLEEQNEKSNACMNDVTAILKGVSENQVRMMGLLETHDSTLEPRVKKLINDEVTRAAEARKRKKASDAG